MTDHFSCLELDAFVVMPNHVHGIIFLVGAGSPRPRPSPVLSQVPGFFKFQATIRINELRQTPGHKLWQRSFYDHIIRDEESLNCIREYIQTNPLRWHLDRENPEALDRDDFDNWLEGVQHKQINRKFHLESNVS